MMSFDFGYLDPVTGQRVEPQPKPALTHASQADVLFCGAALVFVLAVLAVDSQADYGRRRIR